jgi:hypothetical protein
VHDNVEVWQRGVCKIENNETLCKWSDMLREAVRVSKVSWQMVEDRGAYQTSDGSDRW